jgi:hypothetical protein
MSKEEQPYEEVTTGQEQPPKKGLLEEIQEMKASGNTKGKEFKDKIKELEVILGVPQLSPFKTNELDIFEDNLRAMDVTDMMRMAKEVGINPTMDKPRLRESLMKEFKAYTRNNRRNIAPTPSQQMELDPNNPLHAKTLKILRDI